MRFLFHNQYFPPDPAPTGILLREIADRLAAKGHEVHFISSAQDYRAAKKNQRRIVRELRALWTILQSGLKAPRPDVVVSATSPPLLAVVATLIAKRHRARHAHWLFDMYPELAIELGEIKSGLLARFFKRITVWALRKTELVVALDDDMAQRLQRDGIFSEIIPPWVLAALMPRALEAPVHSPQTNVWLYSGNLGRAHEWKTLLETQSLLEKRGSPLRLVFQGGGPSWKLAQERAKELHLQNCEWKPYAAESDLHRALLKTDVLIATQRPETQGLLWPSKLALITALPRRILWIGPTDGAIARNLRALPQAGIFQPGQAQEIAQWLEAGRAENDAVFRTRDAAAARETSLGKWIALLEKLRR